MAFENTFYGFAAFISVGRNDRDRTTVRFNRKTLILFLSLAYSEVPNTRADRNKRAGWYFLRNLLTIRPE